MSSRYADLRVSRIWLRCCTRADASAWNLAARALPWLVTQLASTAIPPVRAATHSASSIMRPVSAILKCLARGRRPYLSRFRTLMEAVMKLAEGLALRADTTRRVEQLRARIVGSARYQEGEEPPEDASALLAEAAAALNDLEVLIRRINRTNAAAQIGADGTLTDALARRDVLRLRHSVMTSAADAAAGRGQGGMGRQLRSELKILTALPVAQLRAQADEIARDLRDLDVRIQRSNWEVDLLD